MYLYDARYNLKTPTTYEKASKLFGIKVSEIDNYKENLIKIRKWYLVEDEIPVKELKKLYEKEVLKNETWKVIEGSNNNFLVSNHGRFKRIYKSKPEGKFIMPYFVPTRSGKNNRDKQYIKCMFKGISKEYSVSRIVAYHFVDIWEEGGRRCDIGKNYKYKKYSFDDVVVYHKNGILYDNYHANLEFLDREDLAKKTAYKSKGGRTIVAIDADTNEIIDYFKSTRHVEKHLPVSKQSVCDSLNKVWKTNIVGGKYIFEYEE